MSVYYKDSLGNVYEFSSIEEREIWGAPDLVLMSEQEIYEHLNPAQPAPTSDMVTTERDRRINGGFVYDGHTYQSRLTDRENIRDCAQLAFEAMVGGAEAGDLRWADAAQDFRWIDADNNFVPMDAPTMSAMGKAAVNHRAALIFKARALKSMNPVPLDYQDDKWW